MSRRKYPPEFHFRKVRKDDIGWVAIAVRQGDEVTVGGETRAEALRNLLAECWRDHSYSSAFPVHPSEPNYVPGDNK